MTPFVKTNLFTIDYQNKGTSKTFIKNVHKINFNRTNKMF